MSFPPATPMSFARILTPQPGCIYDRVTYPNLPQFAETLTFDRYNGNGTPCAPFARCYPEYPQNCESLQTNPFGGLGMLGVPVSWGVRAAANGLGIVNELFSRPQPRYQRTMTGHHNYGRSLLGLGETDQERSDRERARIAHETAMRNATVPGGGSGGPRAPLPPGTTKTPWQAAGDALANAFGPSTPPGTTTDAGEDADEETSSASPPISNAGAPNWGLYVGLSVAAVAAVALIAVLTKKPSVANRRRNRRRRNVGGGRWYLYDRTYANWPGALSWRKKSAALRGQGYATEAEALHRAYQVTVAYNAKYGHSGPLLYASKV